MAGQPSSVINRTRVVRAPRTIRYSTSARQKRRGQGGNRQGVLHHLKGLLTTEPRSQGGTTDRVTGSAWSAPFPEPPPRRHRRRGGTDDVASGRRGGQERRL